MRIIAGKYRAKKLFTPLDNSIRPTADRVREALFNILNSRLDNNWEGIKMLDLFAGTGACGLEALSRGAEKITLVDRASENCRKNVSLFTKEQARIKIITTDATKLPQTAEKYNLFFMDAPYKKGLSSLALQELLSKNYLEAGCLGLVEVEKSEEIEIPKAFELVDERRYGLAKILFLELVG